MMCFSFQISHVPGKNLTIANVLLRAPSSASTSDDQLLQDEADAYIQLTLQSLPATEKRLNKIERKQKEDEVYQQIVKYCKKG